MSLSLTRGIAVQQRLPAGRAAFLAAVLLLRGFPIVRLLRSVATPCSALMRGRTAKTMRHLCESRSEADPRTRAVRSRGGQCLVA